MKTVKAIREEIAETKASMAALIELAETEERDFTDEEQSSFDAFLAQLGNDGEDGEAVTGQYLALEKASNFEAVRKKLLAKDKPVKLQDTNRITPMGLNAPRRLRAFSGETAAADAYLAGQWIKAVVWKDEEAKRWCVENNVPIIRNAQTGDSDPAGGYLVPTPLANAIKDVRDRFGVARQVAQIVPMTSDSLDYPKRTAGVTVYYPGQAAAITASDVTFGNIALAVKKQATLTKIANELMGDSPFNVADFVAMDAGQAIAEAGDDEYLNGDGSAGYGSENGILDVLHANMQIAAAGANWASVTMANFHSLIGALPEKYHFQECSFIVRRQFFAEVMQALAYAAGGNTTGDITSGTAQQFLGYPVRFSSKMPGDGASSCAALFGAFDAATMIGDRADISVAASAEFAFDEDVTTIRTTARNDVEIHDAGDGGGIVGLYTTA